MTRECSIEGCSKAVQGRGWCPMHYQRWRKYGDPLTCQKIEDPTERFWHYTKQGQNEHECWIWTGELNRGGYGRIFIGRRRTAAHRFAYELLIGPIPDGLHIDHLCRNPSCVNPAHLEPVTCRENLLRGNTLQAANAAKTHCDHGHAFTRENTYVRPRGGRACRACHRRWTREYKRRRALSDG